METKRAQPVATSRKRTEVSNKGRGINKPKPLLMGCHRLPFRAHGKEGVNGSSPLEGFSFLPA